MNQSLFLILIPQSALQPPTQTVASWYTTPLGTIKRRIVVASYVLLGAMKVLMGF